MILQSTNGRYSRRYVEKNFQHFFQVLLWAEAECTRKCLEQTLENKRNVLGNILNGIRFAHMDCGKLLKYINGKNGNRAFPNYFFK